MRVTGSAAGALLIAVAILFANATPAAAEIIYPWCGYYGGRDSPGAPNCGFTSFAQCMATVSGSQGTCNVNPFWVPPGQRGQPHRTPTVYVPERP